jgi:hypothetical protein
MVMSEQREWEQAESAQESSALLGRNRWLTVAVMVSLVAAGLTFAYSFEQHTRVSQLTSHDMELNTAINRMQSQMNTLSARMGELSAAQTAAVPAVKVAPANASQPRVRTAIVNRRAPEDNRLKQLQARVDEQQDQLRQTHDEVGKTRSDLEGNLNSTRDELNGSIGRTRDELNSSIARTHDQLVALERRGERNYFEFNLTKSKEFQRFGPLTVSLRKADSKHKNYDLDMVVDDNQLSKKRVNLYEPISIHAGDDVQPVQVVVNKIEKDHVHGYVSAPKYQQPRLAASTTPGTANTPPNQGPANNRVTPQQSRQ